jgi:hypothetical protein
MLTSATIDMLRARHQESVAMAGLVAALFADDVSEAIPRLESACDAARECAANAGRDRQARALYRLVAEAADELIPPVRQLAERTGGVVRPDNERGREPMRRMSLKTLDEEWEKP